MDEGEGAGGTGAVGGLSEGIGGKFLEQVWGDCEVGGSE